jgi:hypothetical protein
MSAGIIPEGHDGIGGDVLTVSTRVLINESAKKMKEGAAAIQALSHALITLAATTRLICIETRHPMPKENLGVAAEALRKAGYPEAAEQVGK